MKSRYDNTFSENRIRNISPFKADTVAGFLFRHSCRRVHPGLSCGVSLEREDAYGLKVDPRLFSTLARDTRISHGAFRAWHILFGMLGKNAYCWPSIRTLAKTLDSSHQSVTDWLNELKALDYVRVTKGNQRASNRYYLNPKVPKQCVPNSGTGCSNNCGEGVPANGTELSSLNPKKEKNSPWEQERKAEVASMFRKLREQISQ